MGSGEGEVTFADAMALLVRRIRTAPTQPPIKCQKKSPRRQARPKSGLRGCVGSIRLWSLTLRLCWWNGLTNKTSQAFPREYAFESSSSLAHLGNSPEG
jgi:hypothetical protein